MVDSGTVIRRLIPQVQPYAWGSNTALPELLGIPATGGPMAELWLGDHPLLPSLVAPPDNSDGTETLDEPLNETLDETLDDLLTTEASDWFDPTSLGEGKSLSFLLKVLAIAAPLSLQTHPNKAQAEQGFAREDALGISRTAANRNYRDANHKPELICALSEMDALSGFRSIEETLTLLEIIDHPSARLLSAALATGLSHAVRAGLTGQIFPDEQATSSFATLARAVGDSGSDTQALDRPGLDPQTLDRQALDPQAAFTLHWWATLCERYPGDGGIAVAILLHCVRLQPGEALFLGAGNMHAYLSGVGIEIMANSDNVLRGGLTPKHVDIEELCAVTNAVPTPLPRVSPVDVSHNILANHSGWAVQTWPVPVDDFRLLRVQGESAELAPLDLRVRPLITLCTEGCVVLHQGEQAVSLTKGESAIIGNSTSPLGLTGGGTLFIASSG